MAGHSARHGEVICGCDAGKSAQVVVVTFGEQGPWLWDGKEWSHEDARPTQLIDRLGAGDVLTAKKELETLSIKTSTLER